MFDLDRLRSYIRDGKYDVTLHMRQRMGLRKITMEEIKTAIITGEVLESYPDTRPFPSLLIMGFVREELPLYVMCALSKDKAHLITAHWMDPEKWLDPRTRRNKYDPLT